MEGLEAVQVYIDNLLVITKGDFDDHLNKLGKVLERLEDTRLKVKASKCHFAEKEVEYLGYIITR